MEVDGGKRLIEYPNPPRAREYRRDNIVGRNIEIG